MRLLGAGLLWISLMFAGVAYSVKLKQRVDLLEKTKLMIEDMKIQLKFLNLPLYDILSNINQKDYLKKLTFITDSCERIIDGEDFHIAWQRAIKSTRLPYKREESERLLHIGLNLGTSDVDNQLSILSLNSEYFDECILKAKLEEKKYGNLTATLGALSGCTIFILLL